jgi:hypothetical protein|tara:strand:- start:768 stop:1265 length:498 start_codon:yes stop_codon:yes gene_type:complete
MKIIRDALPDNIIKLCNDDIDSKIHKRVWGTNVSWQDDLYDGIAGSCLSASLSSSCLLSVRSKLRVHLPEWNNTQYSYHFWMRHAGINWHDDSNHIFGATLYLNEWQKEWGGLFLWEDKDLHCICPEKGMLVVNDIRQPHSVTPVTIRAPYGRKSIQIFGIDKVR